MDHLTSDNATSFSKTSLSEEFNSGDSISFSKRTQDSSSDFLEPSKSLKTSNLKESARLQELTINKLRYDAIAFVGREVESEILRSRLRRVAATSSEDKDAKGGKGIVLIKGYSGVGKSALSQRLQAWTNELENALFVKGKYDLTTKTPYSGIAQAFGKACEEAVHLKKLDNDTSSLGDLLISELGSEVQLLTMLIPELQAKIREEEKDRVPLHDKNGFEAGMEQWKHVFRVLVRVLGSFFSPMVIVLDDLQWTDVASLSIIDFLLTDSQNMNGIMIVGCYRSNEVDHAHVLTKAISILGEKTEKGIFKLTEIELGNLSLGDANKILMAMLNMDDEAKTEPLAEICFKRTLGNPFFFIEFLTMLEAEGLITFSLGALKWVWAVQTVEDSTTSTKNDVELLQDRMKKLTDDIQLLLQYAANLGASFSHDLLEPIWSFHSSNTAANKESCDLQSMYRDLETGNYIERSQSNRFNWVHDKVQEAALSLGKASNPMFQFEIGFILYGRLGNTELEQSVFDVVNLINKGKIDNPQRRMEFCKLNLRAAERARSLSAFDSASKFVASGLKLLPADKWSPPYRELTLPLLTIGAEMALASGSVDRMNLYADEVLFREDCTTVEKLPLYLTMTYKQATMDLEYASAMDLSLAVLKDLGCPIVRNEALMAVQALRALMRIVRTARKEKRDYARSLQMMTDERQKATMTFLNRSLYAAFMMQNVSLGMALVTRMYDITLEHGISPETGPAFATLSMVIVTALKDYDIAAFFAEAGIKTQQRTASKYNEASTLYIAAFASMSWRQPLQSCSDLMLKAYRVGMRSGNTVYAMWGLCMHQIAFPFLLGKPLGPILKAGTQSIYLMEEVKQEEQAIGSRMKCQTIANLMGKSDHTTLLEGEWFASVGRTPPSQLESDYNYHRLALFIYFGDFEAAAELVQSNGANFEKTASSCFMVPSDAFLRGVALFAMVRKTKGWRYRRAAHQFLVKFENWTKNGNPNVKAYAFLLKAEQLAFQKKHKDAESRYKEAIVIASKTGQLHTAGLVSERYADFLLTDKHDLVECQYHKEQAIHFYTEWGANAVVKRIQDSMIAGMGTTIRI